MIWASRKKPRMLAFSPADACRECRKEAVFTDTPLNKAVVWHLGSETRWTSLSGCYSNLQAIHASIAQWQSGCFVNGGSGVRFPLEVTSTARFRHFTSPNHVQPERLVAGSDPRGRLGRFQLGRFLASNRFRNQFPDGPVMVHQRRNRAARASGAVTTHPTMASTETWP